MKKKGLLVLALGVVLGALTGCTLREDVSVKFTGTDCTVSMTYGYDKATAEQLSSADELAQQGFVLQTVDDKQYYLKTDTQTGTSFEDAVSKMGDTSTVNYKGIITNDIVYIDMTESKSDTGDNSLKGVSMYSELEVESTDTWVQTNGDISNDGHTVTFILNVYSNSTYNIPDYLYAYSYNGKQILESDVTAPTIVISDKDYYTESPTFYVNDETAVKSVQGNGKEIIKTASGWVTKTEEQWIKQGENTIRVEDLTGNVAYKTFIYDTKKPTLQGYHKKYKKKATLYAKDKVSGIAKVTYKGKKVKITKVKKGKYKGSYKIVIKKKGKGKLKVYDKAGNVLTKTITIK